MNICHDCLTEWLCNDEIMIGYTFIIVHPTDCKAYDHRTAQPDTLNQNG